MMFNCLINRIKLLACLLGFCAPALCAGSQFDKELLQVGHLKNYLEIFAHSDRNPIWPGFQPAKTPAFLFFRSGRSYALYFSPASASWKVIQTPAGYIYYSEKDNWGITKKTITPHLTVNKQNGFAYNFDQYREELSLHVFIHERFHRHQADHFQKLTPPDHYADSHNQANLAYIDLENKILIDYLRSNKQSSLQDFLIVHNYRNTLIAKSSIAWEKYQQRIEGIASYVELLSKSYYEQKNRDLVAGFLADELFRHRKSMGYAYIVDRAVRWRHYFVGASLALSLDRLPVSGWQKQIEEQGLSPIDLVSKNVSLKGINQKDRLVKIKKIYHFAGIQKQVARRVELYNRTIGRWHTLLKNSPGVYCELQKPLTNLRTINHMQRSYSLADESALEINTSGQVYNQCHTWKFAFKKLPLLLSNKKDWVFKLSRDSKVTINNKALSLPRLLTMHSVKFKNLRIINNKVELSLKAPGLILVNNKHVKIRLTGSAKQGC